RKGVSSELPTLVPRPTRAGKKNPRTSLPGGERGHSESRPLPEAGTRPGGWGRRRPRRAGPPPTTDRPGDPGRPATHPRWPGDQTPTDPDRPPRPGETGGKPARSVIIPAAGLDGIRRDGEPPRRASGAPTRLAPPTRPPPRPPAMATSEARIQANR